MGALGYGGGKTDHVNTNHYLSKQGYRTYILYSIVHILRRDQYTAIHTHHAKNDAKVDDTQSIISQSS